MTLDQVLIVALLIGLLAVFALDRFRIELVALIGLAIALLLGLVPPARAFSGLSSPVVVTVVEILLIVQALEKSHIMDRLGDFLSARLASPLRVTLALCAIGASLSTVMNNIGAFALMLPVAFSISRTAGLPLRAMLMPLSFATLLGGLCSLVGTPANLIVSGALLKETGAGFDFLDFAPTGLAVTLVGLVVLTFWAPRILDRSQDPSGEEEGEFSRRVVAEVLAPKAGASLTVSTLAAQLDGEVHGIVREGRRVFPLMEDTSLLSGDLILIEANEFLLRHLLASGELITARSGMAGAGASRMEAVIMPQSTLVGSRVATASAFSDREVRVVAVTTQNARIEGGLDELRLGVGDILHLEGDGAALRDAVEDAGLIELAPAARLETRNYALVPTAVFALGILVAALGYTSPSIAFGAVVIVLAASGALDLRAALAEMNWPIVLLLVAMLPLGEAVESTGAAAAIAVFLGDALPSSSPLAVTALMLALAMAVTPFVNNATTAVILAPISIELARAADVSPALVLMAVAIGVSCDFLTPFGHHNNTLAFGLGGYRFRDFLRVGWPMSAAAFIAGLIACMSVWS